jgi:enoyl-CoA hydratase/carnithine racemase
MSVESRESQLLSAADGRGGAPEWETLRVTIEEGWAKLTLDRPEQRNAMTLKMLTELREATDYLADRGGVSGLLVIGSGETFSLGGDLAEAQAILEGPADQLMASGRRLVDPLQRAILNMRRMRFPVVAAVNGLAAGGGFGLALACDDRVASPRAAFVAAFGKIGLSPDSALSYMLPRIVGEARAKTIILGEEVVRAEQAHTLGIVSEVVEAGMLEAAALRRLRRLARCAPHSIAAIKELVSGTWQRSLAEHLQRETALFVEACTTEDFRNAINASGAGLLPRFGDGKRST